MSKEDAAHGMPAIRTVIGGHGTGIASVGARGGGGRNDFRERDIMDTHNVAGGSTGVMMIDAAEVLHKTGMLSKRGGIRKTWKARYFVLSKTTLRYYEKPGDSLSLGALSLSNAIIEEVPFHEMGKLYCFCARYVCLASLLCLSADQDVY